MKGKVLSSEQSHIPFTTHLLTDVFTQLEDRAARHGVSVEKIVDQAVQTWLKLDECELTGKEFGVCIITPLPSNPVRRAMQIIWEQVWRLRPVVRVLGHITLPKLVDDSGAEITAVNNLVQLRRPHEQD